MSSNPITSAGAKFTPVAGRSEVAVGIAVVGVAALVVGQAACIAAYSTGYTVCVA